jgi:hypothetical protein
VKLIQLEADIDCGGMDADSAAHLGFSIIASAVRSECELAIWLALTAKGWTDTDIGRFLNDFSSQLRGVRAKANQKGPTS